jgi:hypothetical protein
MNIRILNMFQPNSIRSLLSKRTSPKIENTEQDNFNKSIDPDF